MTVKCPPWAKKWAKPNEKCDCKARLVVQDGLNERTYLACSESGRLPANCTIAHPERIVRPLERTERGRFAPVRSLKTKVKK